MWRGALIFALALGALFLHPAQARAGLHFCNHTASRVSVAVATLDEDIDVHVWGWWQIQPQECKTPIGDNLDRDRFAYSYYAFSAAGTTWSGDIPICLDLVNAFDFNDSQETACATGTKRNFRSLDVGDNTDYTLNFTP